MKSRFNFSDLAPSALALLAGTGLLFPPPCRAQEEARLQGDIGFALYDNPSITRSTGKSKTVRPYLNADYGNFYSRVDTFGYKALPLGNGHLELATRVSAAGYRAADRNIGSRSNPVPVGLGSYQETPCGGFFLYGFHDMVSGGVLLDLMYAAELSAGPVQIYPQLGLERMSARYAQHLYAVSASEATLSGLPRYMPGHASSPYLGVALEYLLPANLKLSFQLTKKWLGKDTTDSPLVNNPSPSTGLLALTQVFK